MELILKDDIQGLGYKNDVVKVRNGYGRNYLIPQGFAIEASVSAKKVLAENLKQVAHKAEKLKKDVMELVASMENVVLEIPAKVSETGKIFGSITSIQISDALKAKGFEIDRKKISFVEKEIKSLGDYNVILDLHKEVKHKITFKVIAA